MSLTSLIQHPTIKALGYMKHSSTYSEPRHQKEVSLTTRKLHNRENRPLELHEYEVEWPLALDVFAER
jgi:hypothetical protein